MRRSHRYGTLFILFQILAWSPVCSYASFLVEFQSGRKVMVESYRTEGKTYELCLENGSLRVPRKEIISIREKKEQAVRISKGETEEVKPDAPTDFQEAKLPRDATPQRAGIESYIRRKAELRERLEDAKKVYFAATEKAEKNRAREAMTSVSRELFSLEEEVRQIHNGSLPEWWKENWAL